MDIVKKQIKYNTSLRNSSIKYIVIHDTGNTGKGANALSHFNFFNGGNRDSSADFFVDDTLILQINDYNKFYTWHCGDGKGKYGITNSNSIGIEICVNSDGNYNMALLKTVELTKYLMQKLNIPSNRVVRHYDASRKKCPASMSKNNWAYWQDFKNRILKSEDLTMSQYEELKKMIADLKPPIYNYIDKNMPEYARETVAKLTEKGILKGDENGLNLDDSMLRMLVMLDRAKVFD